MKQIEIEKYECKGRWKHGYPISHLQFGEKKCRKCDIYWKVAYKGTVCPKCHRLLAYTAKRS
jgi:hypothetical protein